jgi:hypothetical protein
LRRQIMDGMWRQGRGRGRRRHKSGSESKGLICVRRICLRGAGPLRNRTIQQTHP